MLTINPGGPTIAPYGFTVLPFPDRRFDFERAFREVADAHPLPPPVEIVHRGAIHAAVDYVLRARGVEFIRKLDRYERRPAIGGNPFDGLPIRSHVWECEPDFYLAEWAQDDPLVLGAREAGAWRWVLFLNRMWPTVVDAAMYFALAPYDIGLGPLNDHLRRCGVKTVTATLPKAIGDRYLARHLDADFIVTGEDAHRWQVARNLG